MTAILDQKHYIEELNRHLSGTVTDLQAKMDSIEKTNSKLVEEVRLCPCVCVCVCYYVIVPSIGGCDIFLRLLRSSSKKPFPSNIITASLYTSRVSPD